MSSDLSMPSFLCIGIQKAGTSWLYRMATQHPDVCCAEPKEPHFFNRHYDKGIEWYRSHFQCEQHAKAVGEFTPDYLWVRGAIGDTQALAATPDVPARVARHCPDARFIVVLRDPVMRAISSYFHHIGAARVSPNRRISDVGDEWGIRSMGHYPDHLERWFAHFPREQFQILIYEEDLQGDFRLPTLQRFFEHVGVDPDFRPEGMDRRYNPRRTHFDYRLARLPGRMQRIARQWVPSFVENLGMWNIPVSEAEIEGLRDYYAPYNARLSELLGRELPWQ